MSFSDDGSFFCMDAIHLPSTSNQQQQQQQTPRSPFLINYTRVQPKKDSYSPPAHQISAPDSDRNIHIQRWLATHEDGYLEDAEEYDAPVDASDDVHDADNSSDDDDEVDEDSAIFIRRRVQPQAPSPRLPMPMTVPIGLARPKPKPQQQPRPSRSLRVSAATPAQPVVCLSEANADLSSISDDVEQQPRRPYRHPHQPSIDFDDEEFWTSPPPIDDVPSLTRDDDDDSGPASTSTRSIPISTAIPVVPVSSFCGWDTSRGRCRPMINEHDSDDDQDLFWRESPKDAARRERERGRLNQQAYWKPLMGRAIYGEDA